MPFIAFMASGLLLKVSVLISIIDLPSGFLDVTEHLCVLELCVSKSSAAKAGETMPATSRAAIRYFCMEVSLGFRGRGHCSSARPRLDQTRVFGHAFGASPAQLVPRHRDAGATSP